MYLYIKIWYLQWRSFTEKEFPWLRFIKFPTDWVYNLSGRRADRLRPYRFLEAIFSALLDLNPVPDTISLIVNHFSRFLLVEIDNVDKKYRLKSWLRYENLRKESYCFQMTSIRFECLDRCLGIEFNLTVQNSWENFHLQI